MTIKDIQIWFIMFLFIVITWTLASFFILMILDITTDIDMPQCSERNWFCKEDRNNV